MKIRPASLSRRSFIRVALPKGTQVLFGGNAYEACDVSVYGISFLVGQSEAALFRVGMQLPQLTFPLQGKAVTVSARVVRLQPPRASGFQRIAAEFLEIATDDVWFLSRIVTEVSGVGRPSQIKIGKLAIRKRKVSKISKTPKTRKASPAKRR